jgi:thymidylate synthase
MKKSKNNIDNDLITKKYLDERLTKNTSKIIGYVNMQFKSADERFEKIDKKLEMLDSILKTLDWLAKDYKDLKDEHTVQSEQNRRIDIRVTALEKRVFVS